MWLEMMCLESESQYRKACRAREEPLWPDGQGLRAEPQWSKINPFVLNWAGERRAKFAQQCIYPSSSCCCSSHCCPLQHRSTSEGTVSHEIDCWVNITLLKQSKLAINHCLVSLAEAFSRAHCLLCLLHPFFWMT